MKKLLILLVIFIFNTGVCYAATTYNSNIVNNSIAIKIGCSDALVNGDSTKIDNLNGKVTPYIYNDRTMVPVRFLCEAFSASVGYDSYTKKVMIIQGSKNIILTIGDKNMIVNGSIVVMDVETTLNNDRTYVPFGYVAEALGMNKFYKDGLIIISKSNVLVNEVTDTNTLEYFNSQLLHQFEHDIEVRQPNPIEVYVAEIEKIVVTPKTKVIEGKNKNISIIVVNAYLSNGIIKEVTKACSFESKNKNIAYINNQKLYSGTEYGKTDIVVTYEYLGKKLQDIITVTVESDAKIERIVATPTKYFFNKIEDEGPEVRIVAYYSDGTTKDVTRECKFESEDEDVAYIDEDDFIIYSTDEEDQIDIEVSYKEGGKTFKDKIKVEVKVGGKLERKLKNIVATPSRDRILDTDELGKKVQVIAYYSDGTTRNVISDCNFEFGNVKIAYIDDKYRLRSANETGETEIVVLYEENGEDAEDTIIVSVEEDADKELERIVATPSRNYFNSFNKKGNEVMVTAYYSDGSTEDVTEYCSFDSEDEDVAYIELDGYRIYSGTEAGEIEIEVTYEYDGDDCEDKIIVVVATGGVAPPKLDKIVATPSRESIDDLDEVGRKIKVVAHYKDGSTRTVTSDCNFLSDDIKIAYIDNKFRINSGEEVGEVEILVTYSENGDEEEDVITVKVDED